MGRSKGKDRWIKTAAGVDINNSTGDLTTEAMPVSGILGCSLNVWYTSMTSIVMQGSNNKDDSNSWAEIDNDTTSDPYLKGLVDPDIKWVRWVLTGATGAYAWYIETLDQ